MSAPAKSGRARGILPRAASPAGNRRPPQAGKPGAQQAVTGLKVVIEKRQRPVGRERRQPERQPRQLDGHRVHVDAIQAPLGNRPPRRHALALAEIAAVVAHRSGPAPLRTPRPDSGRRRPGTRRCPSPDRRCEAGGCVPGSHRAPAVRASGERGSRRSAGACRTSRWPFGSRSRGSAWTGTCLPPPPLGRAAARSRAAFRTPRRVARRRDRGRRCVRARRDRAPAGSRARARRAWPPRRPGRDARRAVSAPARTDGR